MWFSIVRICLDAGPLPRLDWQTPGTINRVAIYKRYCEPPRPRILERNEI